MSSRSRCDGDERTLNREATAAVLSPRRCRSANRCFLVCVIRRRRRRRVEENDVLIS